MMNKELRYVLLAAVAFVCSSALYLDASKPSRPSRAVKDADLFRAVEQSMLKALGLSSRPKPSKNVRAPRYMWDLFHSHAHHPDWISTKFRFGGVWTDANTIRGSFHEENELVKFAGHHNKWRLFFNVTMPKHESVINAELRLWKEAHPSSDVLHRVAIHQVVRPVREASPAVTRLISTKLVNASYSGWLIFDLKSAVQHWLTHPSENYGLEVDLVTTDGHRVNSSVLCVDKNASTNNDDWHDRRPFLVAFAHDQTRHTHVRRKRDTTSGSTPKKGDRRNLCKRHPLFVDFSDVGWDDWIMAPPGYDAYFCKGKCPFPLTNHMNTTNHAIVQNLVNSVKPNAAPKACCVPTHLTPISILYEDGQHKVVLKNYQDMVVDGCGCR